MKRFRMSHMYSSDLKTTHYVFSVQSVSNTKCIHVTFHCVSYIMKRFSVLKYCINTLVYFAMEKNRNQYMMRFRMFHISVVSYQEIVHVTFQSVSYLIKRFNVFHIAYLSDFQFHKSFPKINQLAG